MHYQYFPLTEIKILHNIPLVNIKLCHKQMALKNELRCFSCKFKINLPIPTERTQPNGKYKMGVYNAGSFREVINIYLNLIMCKYKIFILLILQSYVLHWYHTYLLHLVMDRTEAMICQHLYNPIIRKSVQKEVNKL